MLHECDRSSGRKYTIFGGFILAAAAAGAVFVTMWGETGRKPAAPQGAPLSFVSFIKILFGLLIHDAVSRYEMRCLKRIHYDAL